jgi:hypothetical protein
MTLQITKWNFTCSYVKGFYMKLRLKFHMWKEFTWNYKLQVKFHICERISHERYKLQVTFHMWKDFTWNYKWNFTYVKRFHKKLQVKFQMWKEFTWNYKLQVKLHICERISHEITSEISHMWKYFTWNYKWNFTCTWKDFTWNYKWNFTYVKEFHMNVTNYKWHFTFERISHEITSEISHMRKDFTWNYKVKFHMYVKGFHMKLRLKFHMWKDFTWNYKLQSQISHVKG